MTTSLIITTYNWKEALELVLLSVLRQTKLPDEVIVADDGSSDGTHTLLEKFQMPTPLIHSWQEDQGFRAAKSRNRAIAKASGTYIILIDGDMILDKNFIQDHISFAKQGSFTQGGRVIFEENLAKKVLANKYIEFSFFQKGIKNRKNMIRFAPLSYLFSSQNHKTKGLKTCNMAFFRKDCLHVNGFNEDFVGWGREDSEFCQRLFNAGLTRRDLKFSATAYHIYHHERPRKSLSKNDEILQNTINQKLFTCKNGIDKYLT